MSNTGDKMDGLWTLQYRLQGEWVGSGVIVFKDGKIYGGDSGYYYVGQYAMSGPHLAGRANVIRHDPQAKSMFGTPIEQFDIEMQGTCENAEVGAIFEAEGKAFTGGVGVTFSVIFKKTQNLE